MINKLIKIALFVVILCLANNKLHAQELNIGVPLIDEPVNIFSNKSFFSKFILTATTQTLVRVESFKDFKIKLILADSFNFSADQKRLELRLRGDAMFVNSELINKNDMEVSLNRCAAKVDSDYLIKFRKIPTFDVENKDKRIKIILQSDEGLESLLSFVDTCPILEARSQKLFSEDLGSSNAFIGTGPYDLVSRTKNREARLERVFKTNGKAPVWAASITLRGFVEAGHALTALRTGTVDAFYSEGTDVLEKASNDPTLLIKDCGVYNIILRKGLEISCFPNMEAGSIKYSAL